MSLYDDELARETSRASARSYLIGLGVFALVTAYLTWLFLVKAHVLDVKPEPAAQTASYSVVQGTGFAFSNRIYTFSGQTVVQVQAPNYEPSEVTIDSQSAALIEVTLKPIPVKIKATLNPPVEGAQWLIDGQQVHTGASLDTELPVGRYSLEVLSPFHEKYSTFVDLKPPAEEELIINLTPFQVSLIVDTKPVGTQVLMDGQELRPS
ncbi:MAG: hypothetical protein R3194_12360, partial [Limnobacter sp.]|nr:hypothetical protein [Limnobacter sp.]